jgi:hypothetical protein
MSRRPDTVYWSAPEIRPAYRRIYIVESRRRWKAVQGEYIPGADLVLTYDFGLRREIRALGGEAHYVDQLVDPEVMRANNLLVYRFFEHWSVDATGRDLFEHMDVPFSQALRTDFWNDLLSYARICLCLERLRGIQFERLVVGTDIGLVERVLGEWDVPFTAVDKPAGEDIPNYSFPIHQWMRENIRRVGAKAKVYAFGFWLIGRVRGLLDAIMGSARRPTVFVQEYYPTQDIAHRLRRDSRVRVMAAAPTRAHPLGRAVPLPTLAIRHHRCAERLWARFGEHRASRLILSTGMDVSRGAFRLIEERLTQNLPHIVRTVEAVVRYTDQDPFALAVLISNIGEISATVSCVCRRRGIPTYLIINGFLVSEYGDDSKHATTINSYSPSIGTHYFRGMPNVVHLGDPRMDRYPPHPRRALVPGRFTVTIGAAGFNLTDLNSYVAVEFDFLHDVLEGLSRVKRTCPELRVVVKVRANGYRDQYERFTAEYFPGLVEEIVDQGTVTSLLANTDFYVSIYSTTLFEASCLGIPVLYYRVGDYYKSPPFDGGSEMVTAQTIDEVVRAVDDARAGHPRFDLFLDRTVMSQYVGPLDGHNTERNLRFIYEQLGMSPPPGSL